MAWSEKHELGFWVEKQSLLDDKIKELATDIRNRIMPLVEKGEIQMLTYSETGSVEKISQYADIPLEIAKVLATFTEFSNDWEYIEELVHFSPETILENFKRNQVPEEISLYGNTYFHTLYLDRTMCMLLSEHIEWISEQYVLDKDILWEIILFRIMGVRRGKYIVMDSSLHPYRKGTWTWKEYIFDTEKYSLQEWREYFQHLQKTHL